jgi:5-formyltetrahydrofolate cyclo-ligase
MVDERPLHSQVRDRIREIILAAPVGRTVIAPEPQLAERMRVSRGTVRKAVDSLVAEGLLVREQGRGTFVEPGAQVRRLISNRLAAVAKPDSRLDDDFQSFIPDFEGSDECAATIAKLPAYADAKTIFASRDNNLQPFRQRALEDSKRLIVPSHALRTGLRVVESVPAGFERFAAMLDGLDEFAKTISLEEVADFGPVSLAVTGAVAVTRDGVMFGARHDFFRIEVAVLAATDALAGDALTIGVVHDCQVIDLAPGAEPPHAAFLDLVATPSATYEGAARYRSRSLVNDRLDRKTISALIASINGSPVPDDEGLVRADWLSAESSTG